ncbi:hypothetical protein ACFXHA_43120 [Nocardia sp. NPDC059240]|uniref:hypothetical protein n=1 Tax=Nocardia sp. NPDC059240 TaxID=3346786 RepID=UPI003687ABE9
MSRTPSPVDPLTAGPLPDRVATARTRVTHQYDPALTDALSERELSADRDLAERVRDHDRRERLARLDAAEAAAERLRRTTGQLAERQAADLIRAGQAIAEQRLSSSPHAKVARLHRRKSVVLGVLTGVLVLAMVISAVSVQHNIAPDGGPANVWWWLAYGVEFLISGMLISLMISTGDTAEWEVIEDPRQVYGIEAVLLAVTVTLNTYPYFHGLQRPDWFGIGVHSIAPIAIGAALWTYEVVAARYGQAIERATAAIPDGDTLAAQLATLTDLTATAPATTDRLAVQTGNSLELGAGRASAIRESAPADPRVRDTAPEPALANPRIRETAPADTHPHFDQPATGPARIESPLFQTAIPQWHPSAGPRRRPASAPADSFGEPATRAFTATTAGDDTTTGPATNEETLVTVTAPTAPESATVDREAASADPVTAILPRADRAWTATRASGQSPESESAPESEIAHLAEVADEVRRRRPRMRTPRDLVIAILAADEQGTPYTAIGKELEVHHETVLNILETARKVRHGATVVEFRKGQAR